MDRVNIEDHAYSPMKTGKRKQKGTTTKKKKEEHHADFIYAMVSADLETTADLCMKTQGSQTTILTLLKEKYHADTTYAKASATLESNASSVMKPQE